jgi:hypothetical protein
MTADAGAVRREVVLAHFLDPKVFGFDGSIIYHKRSVINKKIDLLWLII